MQPFANLEIMHSWLCARYILVACLLLIWCYGNVYCNHWKSFDQTATILKVFYHKQTIYQQTLWQKHKHRCTQTTHRHTHRHTRTHTQTHTHTHTHKHTHTQLLFGPRKAGTNLQPACDWLKNCRMYSSCKFL